MPTAARLRLGCCLAAAALLGAGCGAGGDGAAVTAAGMKTGAARAVGAASGHRPQRRGLPAGARCQAQLGGFVSSMDDLRRRLAVGVTYEQYVDEIRAVGATYRKIPVGRLALGCLASAGRPAESAYNRYIEAADSWGRCIARTRCDAARVEPVLQRQWRAAARLLRRAGSGFGGSGA